MKHEIFYNSFSKFNWLLLGVICILLASCKDNKVNSSAKSRTETNKSLTEANKQTKAKKKEPFYDFLRLNNKLDQSDINTLKAILKKYDTIKSTLKKQNKWAGASNKAARKIHFRNQQVELKKTLGSSYQILQKERKRWKSKSKKSK